MSARSELPKLLDRAGVRRHFGLTKVDVERVFQRLPVVSLPESRKVYVRAADLLELIEEHCYRPGERVRQVA